jgi:hypothetical protein
MSDISQRQQVAQNLADLCVFGGLNDSYGVSIKKTTDPKGKSYWAVTFCKARFLNGHISVYSPYFIFISWQALDSNYKGREVLKNETAAKDFITDRFIKRFL